MQLSQVGLAVDFHSHSIASHHAQNSIDEMLRAAASRGLVAVALTDHSPGLDNTIYLLAARLQQADLQADLERVQAPDKHYFHTLLSRYAPPPEIKLKLFKGIECNILGPVTTGRSEWIDVPPGLEGQLDLVIASIHEFEHLFDAGREDVNAVLQQVVGQAALDIVGHPYSRRYQVDYVALARVAATAGVALEVNNSYLRYKRIETDVIRSLLAAARQADCQISVSSDAHAAAEIGFHQEVLELIRAMDFPPELIVNRSLESALEFCNSRRQLRQSRVC
ncbi:MAG: PHP domain-containing protein [Leptospiraceae bacterium]|nr:PHP domain-containing protein [Leptospiraceae bacterium]